jgi:hypothetical protein
MAITVALWVLTSVVFVMGVFLMYLLIRLIRSHAAKDTILSDLRQQLNEAQAEISRKEGVIRTEKAKAKLGIIFLAEETLDSGLFRDKYIISYKFQLTLDKIPVGIPGLIKQDKYRKVDKAQVNKMLDEYAKPMIDAGLDVAKQALVAAASARL